MLQSTSPISQSMRSILSIWNEFGNDWKMSSVVTKHFFYTFLTHKFSNLFFWKPFLCCAETEAKDDLFAKTDYVKIMQSITLVFVFRACSLLKTKMGMHELRSDVIVVPTLRKTFAWEWEADKKQKNIARDLEI